ncbi:MAG: hypothetical protein M0022_00985 [Desulfobacteraceae bacterium]|nr:hypothetical protein [Desulfobacteraceae bacterium]
MPRNCIGVVVPRERISRAYMTAAFLSGEDRSTPLIVSDIFHPMGAFHEK